MSDENSSEVEDADIIEFPKHRIVRWPVNRDDVTERVKKLLEMALKLLGAA